MAPSPIVIQGPIITPYIIFKLATVSFANTFTFDAAKAFLRSCSTLYYMARPNPVVITSPGRLNTKANNTRKNDLITV